MSSSSYSPLEGESVAGGVEDPGVVLGALLARVQPQRLVGQLPRAHRARVGQRAQLLKKQRDGGLYIRYVILELAMMLRFVTSHRRLLV